MNKIIPQSPERIKSRRRPRDGMTLAESVVTELTQPSAGGVLAAGRAVKWERERKFRTIWDAVAWLNKHRHEIDLDKPYKPRK